VKAASRGPSTGTPSCEEAGARPDPVESGCALAAPETLPWRRVRSRGTPSSPPGPPRSPSRCSALPACRPARMRRRRSQRGGASPQRYRQPGAVPMNRASLGRLRADTACRPMRLDAPPRDPSACKSLAVRIIGRKLLDGPRTCMALPFSRACSTLHTFVVRRVWPRLALHAISRGHFALD